MALARESGTACTPIPESPTIRKQPVVTWAELEAAEPALAEAGRRLIHRGGEGAALLATARGGDPPRIHPINVGIVGGHLYTFLIGRSPKCRDLEAEGRYALHSHVDSAEPSEFSICGRAVEVRDAVVRSRVAADWSFEVDDSYVLFELSIDSALLGIRATADDWPPRYTSWPLAPDRSRSGAGSPIRQTA